MPRERRQSLLSVKSENQLIRGQTQTQAQTRLAQDASQIDLDADQPGPNTTALKRDGEARPEIDVMEHDPTKRWAEAAVAATALIFFALHIVPYGLKKGQVWYSVCQGLVLLSTVVSLTCLFFGNTHATLLRFLAVNGVFWQVVVLVVVNWVRVIVWPDVGWEVNDRITESTFLLYRLAFFCQDALKGISRWFRVFTAGLFLLANLLGIVQAYFLNPPIAIYTINATNTTITTTGIQASVGTTIFSITLTAIINIWNDPAFQYFALVQSFLPKLAIDAEGLEPGSPEMLLLLEEHETAKAAWMGWPTKGAVAVLLSIFVYTASLALSRSPLAYGEDGKESALLIILRSAALFFLISGSMSFFFNNIAWRRLKYTFTCPQGVLWVLYVTVYFVVRMAKPDTQSPVSSVFSAMYASLALLLWLAMESVKRVSRVMRVSLTLFTALTLALTFYLSAYVWLDDRFLVDLNPIVPGVLTTYQVWRTCWMTLGLLMAGSLYTTVFDWTEGKYMVFVSGYVPRKEVLEMKSVFDLVVGDSEGEVEVVEAQLRNQSQARISQSADSAS